MVPPLVDVSYTDDAGKVHAIPALPCIAKAYDGEAIVWILAVSEGMRTSSHPGGCWVGGSKPGAVRNMALVCAPPSLPSPGWWLDTPSTRTRTRTAYTYSPVKKRVAERVAERC